MCRTKKIRSLVVLSALCILLSTGAGAAYGSDFDDVSRSYWAYGEIVDVADKGIFLGTGARAFSPEMVMDRSMFVTALARLAGAVTDNSGASAFFDVPAGKWYTGAIRWAAESGIVKGVSGNYFAPQDTITREQMAVMVVRYAEYMDVSLPRTERRVTFADARDISSFARDAVEACQRAGLLQGVGKDRFAPQATVTRAQVAVLLSRLSGLDGTVAYRVDFNSNGGKEAPSQTVRENRTVPLPLAVTRSGYSLDGWYTDERLTRRFDFTTPITSNMTLYAKWSTSGARYPAPTIPAKEDVEYALDGGSYDGIQLTYPSTAYLDNGIIVLEGAYTPGTRFTGLDRYIYNDGYVVPIQFSAPSSYSRGEGVYLMAEGGMQSVNTSVKLVGNYYFYLLMYIPDSPPKGWNPVITIQWGDDAVSYGLDVSGMYDMLSDPAADAHISTLTWSEAASIRSDHPSDNIVLPTLQAAQGGAGSRYNVYLSGSYSLYNSGLGYYIVPLRLYAPSKSFSGSAEVAVYNAPGNSSKAYNSLSGVNYVDYLLEVPVRAGSNWYPSFTVTWTESGRWSWLGDRNGTVTTYEYSIDTSGMYETYVSQAPLPATIAQMQSLKGDDTAFNGIEAYTAKAGFDNQGALQVVNGTYTPLMAGQNVPGFGTVQSSSSSLTTSSVIIPVSFRLPAGMAPKDYSNKDVMLTYRTYRADMGPSTAVSTNKVRAQLNGDSAFLCWLLVNDVNNQAYRDYGIQVDLFWADNYSESYVFRLGTLTPTYAVSKAPAVPTREQVDQLARGYGDSHQGIHPWVAQPSLSAVDTVNGVYQLSGAYAPVPGGTGLPGFGTAGSTSAGLGGDYCIIPLLFAVPDNMNLGSLRDRDQAVTLNVRASTDSGWTVTDLETDVSLRKQDVKNGVLRFLKLDDPQSAGDRGLAVQFEFQWKNGPLVVYTFRFSNFTRTTVNNEGARYNTSQAQKDAITSGGAYQGAAINQVDITATTSNGVVTLKLNALDGAQSRKKIRSYFGDGYGEGYIVALKFDRPNDGRVTQVRQSVARDYASSEARIETAVLGNAQEHILVLYIPTQAPRADYGPAITLEWLGDDGTVYGTASYVLDLSGMGVAAYEGSAGRWW